MLNKSLKIGDRVMCIDNSYAKEYLVLNKLYTVGSIALSFDNTEILGVRIIDEQGDIEWFSHHCFDDVILYRNLVIDEILL